MSPDLSLVTTFDAKTTQSSAAFKDSNKDKQSGNFEILFSSAEILYANKEYELAKPVLLRCASIDPHNIASISMLARIFSETKDLENTKKCLQTINRIKPNSENSFAVADIFYQMQNFSLAKAYLEESISYADCDQNTWFQIFKLLGNVYVKLGDYAAAEDYYNRAHRIYPESDHLQVNYAVLEMQVGNLEKARDHFLQAIKYNEKNDTAWVGISMIHRQTSDSQIFWASLRRALDVNPYNKHALHLAADAGLQDFEYDFAIEHIKNFLKSQSFDFSINTKLAALLFQKGNLDEFVFEIQKLRAFEPEHPDVLKLLELAANEESIS